MGALFRVRDSFFIGAYRAAISEGDKSFSEAEVAVRDFYVYRSYVALGEYELVIEEIKEGSNIALDAVKLLAKYLSGEKENVKNSFKDWLADPAISANHDVRLIAGTMFAHEQDYNEALKYTHAGETLELAALNVQMYLNLHRPERAEQQLKAMQRVDEEHTLTQLANAWVNLAQGGSKIQEASHIFRELAEKYPQTVPLMNGLAVCYMHMGRFSDAESLLRDAHTKDSKNPDTLANLVVCDLHTGKSYARDMRLLKALKLSVPLPFVEQQAAAERNFEQAMQAMEAFA